MWKFGRKSTPPASLEAVDPADPATAHAMPAGCVDLHCHLLPGVDDGATDLEAALRIAAEAVQNGITTVVATPHTLDGVFDVARPAAHAALAELRTALREHAIPLDVRLAAEVRLHESVPDLLRAAADISLDGNGRYLLLELPHDSVPDNLGQFLFRLRASGTTPLIAHPERNLAVRRDPALVAEWIGAGALMQLTAGSLSGAFGPVIGDVASHLLRAGQAHVIATDAHSMHKRPPILRAGFAAAAAIVGHAAATQLVRDNPARILAGEATETIHRLSAIEAPAQRGRRRLVGSRHRS